MREFLVLSDEVRTALEEKRPLVALESTIISHGMPYPQNLSTAVEVENIVREHGATPATIAIMNGKCLVGLNESLLVQLASAKNVWKVSIRDMPYVVSQQLIGATTVAATMRIASAAGIKVFATGGIGGVHRGATQTLDISADLTEMKETSVAIVSAGIKSILDIGLTLEYLETLGIPVVTVGQNEFPSFYSRSSDYSSPLRLDQPRDIAAFLQTKWKMGLNGSVLIANPVGKNEEVPASTMETYIQEALTAAEKTGIKGKEVTPYLLGYIAKHTKGKSLGANISLIKNNARLAAQIAVFL
ncbi:MAG: pseudouridine-5'-phosphate glycosidase [Chitinophagaceae bacterium]